MGWGRPRVYSSAPRSIRRWPDSAPPAPGMGTLEETCIPADMSTACASAHSDPPLNRPRTVPRLRPGLPRAAWSVRSGSATPAPANASPAASRSVAAWRALPGRSIGSMPMQQSVKRFGLAAMRSAIRLAVSGSGGLEISTTRRVASSRSRASMADRVVAPPTAAPRSLPPTPIPWLIPPPARAIRQATSCNPVPEAAIRPISPRGTALAKPMGAPATIAVPQSGPIIRRPRPRARVFSAISSSTATLSENSITLRPRSSARRASRAAKSPGTDTMARLAPGSARSPVSSERGFHPASSRPPAAGPRSAASAASKAARSASPSSARTAITRSLGPAPSASASRSPASRSSSLLEGLPIIREAAETPAISWTACEIRISATESR